MHACYNTRVRVYMFRVIIPSMGNHRQLHTNIALFVVPLPAQIPRDYICMALCYTDVDCTAYIMSGYMCINGYNSQQPHMQVWDTLHDDSGASTPYRTCYNAGTRTITR